MKISIFGIGYVGAVSSACLADLGHEIIGVDVSPDKVAMLNRGQSPIVEAKIDGLIAQAVANGRLRATIDVAEAIANSDVSFISVGTPSAPNGSVSLRAVDEVAGQIGRALKGKITPHTIVMRSTVPPGTGEERVLPTLERESGRTRGPNLRYYSNPEFLRESTAVDDFHHPPFTLIGTAKDDEASVAREIYGAIDAPIHLTSYRIAESVKCLSNVYHAVKLAFANEAGAILAAHGVDAREAFRLFCEDRVLNVSAAYLRPGFAFGGSCLPKDIRSFLALADARDIAAPFLKQVMPSNQTIIDRAYETIAAHGRQRVALFGLAFKQGTDDLRESPLVALAEKLIGKGYDLRIFDRSVEIGRLTGANRSFIEREIPHLERLMVGNPAGALEGSGIAVIGHIGKEDRPAFLGALKNQTVIDLAGIAELKTAAGVQYHGLCW